MDSKIILRSAFKITKAIMEPSKDPETGRYPDSVRRVDSNGDIRLTEEDKKSGKVFIAENEHINIFDGKTFDLEDPFDAAWWEAIKHSSLIAIERFYRDANGQLVIDGDARRYGVAEVYVERPGRESQQKVSKARLVHDAEAHIFADTHEGLYQKVRLLGSPMKGLPVNDVQNFLLEKAKLTPAKVIELYTGGDTSLKLLLLDALDRKVILFKNKQLYQYGDTTVLGASQESVILWMKNPANNRLLSMIKADTYPEFYEYPEVESGDFTVDNVGLTDSSLLTITEPKKGGRK